MNILVIHASAGAGHRKAAEALCEGIKRRSSHRVVLVDALDYTSPFFKKLYSRTYFILISRFPFLWAFFFWSLDLPWLQPLVRFIRRLYNAANAGPLQRFMQEEQFDYIFSTHFLPTEVAAALKRAGKINTRIVTVVTDFDVHRIWLAKGVDIYTVASPWTKEKLLKLGIAENMVLVSGIPTGEPFRTHPQIPELKRKLGLQEDIFTVLIATGSFGIGPIEEIIAALEGMQAVVVCGHNKALYKKLSGEQKELVKVLGLVDNMHELMAACDVMVTKPGGLSISEALVSQLPMVFFNPIPGQETNNVRVLGTYGIGVSPKDVAGIVQELKVLQSSKDAFLTALKRTQELARPGAVNDILALIHE